MAAETSPVRELEQRAQDGGHVLLGNGLEPLSTERRHALVEARRAWRGPVLSVEVTQRGDGVAEWVTRVDDLTEAPEVMPLERPSSQRMLA